MASNQFVILAIVAVVVLPTVALATEYIVGGDQGWTLGVNYSEWAKDKMFMVGDSLVFKYDPALHNVIKVNGTEFQACNASPANPVLKTGNDTIPLAAPGKKWYICGTPTHCEQSQKLVITVLSDTMAPAPAPTSWPPKSDKAPAPKSDKAPAPAPSSSPPKSAAYGVVMAAIVAAAMIVA